jgi:hypothetical protein
VTAIQVAGDARGRKNSKGGKSFTAKALPPSFYGVRRLKRTGKGAFIH